MTADVTADVPDIPQRVRVTIEVADLTEVWEMPMNGSALASSLAAVEAIAAELRARYEMAQELERQLGDG